MALSRAEFSRLKPRPGNLTNDQRSILRGRVYNRTKKTDTDSLKRGTKLPQCPSGTAGDTADTLATKHGVGRRTIIRDGKKADAFTHHQDVQGRDDADELLDV